MVIGVDGNEANVSQKVGVSVYTYNLLKYFYKKANKNLRFIIYLKNPPLGDLPSENSNFKYKIVPGSLIWSQFFLPVKLYQKKEIDVFFSPAHYAPFLCPVPSVVTIHDLAYLSYKKDFLLKDLIRLIIWTKYSVKKATKVIAVSNSTKKDIVKLYKKSQNEISVVYNGYEKTSPKLLDKFKINHISNPYILYVGTLQPRKNIPILIEAFNKFKQFYPEFKLLIAGKKGWLYDKIFRKITELGLENEVHFTDFITNNQLIFLYENAFCLVMPSLYEGFGLPIIEAMSFDCPVIASLTSSLPEVGGDSALYFDPNNYFDLVEKLTLLKEHPKLRLELIEKGKHQINKFSWEKCGEETLSIIKSAVLK